MLESERYELSELAKDLRETAEAGRELIGVLSRLDLVIDFATASQKAGPKRAARKAA